MCITNHDSRLGIVVEDKKRHSPANACLVPNLTADALSLLPLPKQRNQSTSMRVLNPRMKSFSTLTLFRPSPLPHRHLLPPLRPSSALLRPPSPILAESDFRISGIVKVYLRNSSLDERPDTPVKAGDTTKCINFREHSLHFVVEPAL